MLLGGRSGCANESVAHLDSLIESNRKIPNLQAKPSHLTNHDDSKKPKTKENSTTAHHCAGLWYFVGTKGIFDTTAGRSLPLIIT